MSTIKMILHMMEMELMALDSPKSSRNCAVKIGTRAPMGANTKRISAF